MARKIYKAVYAQKHGKKSKVAIGYQDWDDIEYGKTIMADSKYQFPAGRGMSTYGATSDLYKLDRDNGQHHILSFDNGFDSYWGKAKIKTSKSIKKTREQARRIKQYLEENRGQMDPAKERRFQEALNSANVSMQYKQLKNKADYAKRKQNAAKGSVVK